jgi:hypothetical protein
MRNMELAEAACRRIYDETNNMYDRYRTKLGPHDLGVKILYGPPHERTPVLFIGSQPGGGVKNEKPRERFEWPARCE